MTDRSERAVLNHLIETCKDAERGFRHIAEQAADPVLKSLFLDIASQRDALRPTCSRTRSALAAPVPTRGPRRARCTARGSIFAAQSHAEIRWQRCMRPSEVNTSRAVCTEARSTVCCLRLHASSSRHSTPSCGRTADRLRGLEAL
jgi:hypothetical protein